MLICKFTIEGGPVPWARHRGIGKGATTPPKQKAYKKTIAQYAWTHRGSLRDPIEGTPLRLQGRFFIAPAKKLEPEIRDLIDQELLFDLRRPDLDNWLKLPMDGLNGLIWKDDAQVVSFDGSGKWLSLRPRLEIEVHRLEQGA